MRLRTRSLLANPVCLPPSFSPLQGLFVKFIQQETQTRVQIKGQGSGYIETDTGRESDEPIHINITCVFLSSFFLLPSFLLSCCCCRLYFTLLR